MKNASTVHFDHHVMIDISVISDQLHNNILYTDFVCSEESEEFDSCIYFFLQRQFNACSHALVATAECEGGALSYCSF